MTSPAEATSKLQVFQWQECIGRVELLVQMKQKTAFRQVLRFLSKKVVSLMQYPEGEIHALKDDKDLSLLELHN